MRGHGLAIAALVATTLWLPAVPVRAAGMAPVQPLAMATLPAKTSAGLSVRSPAFGAGGDIPFENTQYRGDIFPGLAWSPGPKGTLSYAVIMQDPDSTYHGAPILHWTIFNIPAGVTKLDAGMTSPPAGASYGPNIRGPKHAYMGPHTPPGPRHHYHFQVFAVNAVLPEASSDSFDNLVGAMRGHVLAEGQLIGLARADPDAPPRAAPPAPPPTHP